MNKVQLQERLQHFKEEDEMLGVEFYLLYEDEGIVTTYLPAAEETRLSASLSSLVKSTIKNKFFIETDDYQYEVVSANTAEANNIRQVFHITKNEIPKASMIFGSVVNDSAL
jgi:hypothetical protein